MDARLENPEGTAFWVSKSAASADGQRLFSAYPGRSELGYFAQVLLRDAAFAHSQTGRLGWASVGLFGDWADGDLARPAARKRAEPAARPQRRTGDQFSRDGSSGSCGELRVPVGEGTQGPR